MYAVEKKVQQDSATFVLSIAWISGDVGSVSFNLTVEPFTTRIHGNLLFSLSENGNLRLLSRDGIDV
jgi:hypothetical protein